MSIKFDKKIFRKWFELNDMTRNGVMEILGQRDPNKAGRWILGQPIGTKDLIKLCNHFDFQIDDFFIYDDEDEEEIVETILPEEIKQKRRSKEEKKDKDKSTETAPNNSSDSKSTSLIEETAKELAIARISLKYEQEIKALNKQHQQELKESIANTRNQINNRTKFIESQQNTIQLLNETINQLHNDLREKQEIIESQRNTIATLDALVRKQKKMPKTIQADTFGSVTMANDGGGGTTANQ